MSHSDKRRAEPLPTWDIQQELAGYRDRGCYLHPSGCLAFAAGGAITVLAVWMSGWMG